MTATAIAEQLGGARVLHHEIRSDFDLVAALQEGFPAEATNALLDRGGMTPDELHRLVIPRRTLAKRRKTDGKLTVEESNRLTRIARILAGAEETFQDSEKAYRWIRKPNRGLEGRIPLDLLATEAGARLVEQALGRITHGIFA